MQLMPMIEDVEATGEDFDDAIATLPEGLIAALPEGKRNLLLGDMPETLRRIIFRQLAATHCYNVVSERLEEYGEIEGRQEDLGTMRTFVNAINIGELNTDDAPIERLKQVCEAHDRVGRHKNEKLLNERLEAERLEALGALSPQLLAKLDPAVQSALTSPVSARAGELARNSVRTAIGQANKLCEVSRRSIESLQVSLTGFLENYSHLIPELPIEGQTDLVDICAAGVTDANKPTAARLVELIIELQQDEKEALRKVPDLESQRDALKQDFPRGLENIGPGSWYHTLFLGDMESAVRGNLAYNKYDPEGDRAVNSLLAAADNVQKQLEGSAKKWIQERHDVYTKRSQERSRPRKRRN